MAQVVPNFLIAGAGKSGTTSLHEYLAQHPDIFMSTFKEPNYFVPRYGYESWDDYLGLFAGARGQTAVGESSTGYLYCEESPAWIRSVLGRVKIILILRNPARRAVSLYWWMVREGYENATTFREALAWEPERLQSPAYGSHSFYADYFYFTSGLYSEQVCRYFDTFGHDHVRIYIFEEFIKDPLFGCQDIFEYLAVDPNFRPNFAVYNKALRPMSPRLQYWLRTKASNYGLLLPLNFKQSCLDVLMTMNTRLGTVPSADPAIEKELMDRYRSDVSKLEKILNRDLSIWHT